MFKQKVLLKLLKMCYYQLKKSFKVITVTVDIEKLPRLKLNEKD